ncbi:MAG TPA: DUF6263 family protein [Pirellulales bacterium]|nr:DUF6263 family protein [Pirellulales bacterium]
MWYVVKPFFLIRWLPAPVAPVFLACAFLTTAARAEEARTLRWKFVAGQTNRYLLEQDMVSEQTSEGHSMKTTVKQTMNVIWRVKAVDDQGVAEVTQAVDRVRMNVQRPREAGPPLAFDSAAKNERAKNGAAKNGTDQELKQLAAHFEPLLKHPFAMKIDPKGVVSDVEIPETIRKALKGSEPGSGGDEAFKEMLMSSTVQFPTKPLKAGSSWKHTVETKTPFGKQKAITTYTYGGIEKHEGHDLDKIDLKLDVELVGGDEDKVKPKIVSQESEGVIYFDGEQGWLARQRTTSKVEMELMQGDMKIGETVSTTTRIQLVSDDQAAE